jgi:hypothetical protein
MLTHPVDAAVRCARIAVVAVRVDRATAGRLARADVRQTGASLLTEAVVGVGRPVAAEHLDRRARIKRETLVRRKREKGGGPHCLGPCKASGSS